MNASVSENDYIYIFGGPLRFPYQNPILNIPHEKY